MSAKPARPNLDPGPVTHGKGLDSLDGFIIQNWAPPTRFGIWSKQVGTLSVAKVSLAHFLDEALHSAWKLDGGGAILTIDPLNEPLVAIRVENEHKAWTPESKYHPKHWLWKVVPMAKALPDLEEAMRIALPEVEAHYLQGLLDRIHPQA